MCKSYGQIVSEQYKGERKHSWRTEIWTWENEIWEKASHMGKW